MKMYQFTTVINVPLEAIDLYQWLTNVSDKEYQSFSPAHRAMGLFKQDGEDGIVNVESIGGNLLIQHYIIKEKGKHELLMLSEHSDVYLSHFIHLHISVRWHMKVTYRSETSCTFFCEIGSNFPTKAFALVAKLALTGYFLQRHLNWEATKFAQDIEKKVIEHMKFPDPRH